MIFQPNLSFKLFFNKVISNIFNILTFKDILKEFFEEIIKSSKNCLNYVSNEEKQILEKHLNIS